MLAQPPRNEMSLLAALDVIARSRTDEIVVTTMGAAREWPKLSQHLLDFHYLPSAMGQAPLIGLGLALARPDKKVIAFTGDGSLLMNLGCLVTIAASQAKNLTVVLLDNRRYEVTGGQKTASAVANVDFAAMAAAAGIGVTFQTGDLSTWTDNWPALRDASGPVFIALDVAPVGKDYHLVVPGPMKTRIASFRAALGTPV
jgi:thiamine pyrophosphate-dependent acetolactate synthase large subunit-like protein